MERRNILRYFLGIPLVTLLLMISVPIVVGAGTHVIANSENDFAGDYAHACAIRNKFTSKGYTSTVISRPSSVNLVSSCLQNQDSFFISAHGLNSGSSIVLQSSTYYGPGNVPNSVGCSLVFYSICCGAKNNPSGENLCVKTVQKGADVAISYEMSVDTYSSRIYEKYFYTNYVTFNNTAYRSYVNAKNATRSVTGQDNAVTESVKIYGSASQTLQ